MRKRKNNEPQRRSRKQITESFKENVFIPVQLKSAEFKKTARDEEFLSGEWEHLMSGELITVNVFEITRSSLPSDLEALYDAILPPEMDSFNDDDLLSKPLYIKIQYSGENNKFTNICEIKAFDTEHTFLYECYLDVKEEAERLKDHLGTEVQDGQVYELTTLKEMTEDESLINEDETEFFNDDLEEAL